jgi:hypothetical protein
MKARISSLSDEVAHYYVSPRVGCSCGFFDLFLSLKTVRVQIVAADVMCVTFCDLLACIESLQISNDSRAASRLRVSVTVSAGSTATEAGSGVNGTTPALPGTGSTACDWLLNATFEAVHACALVGRHAVFCRVHAASFPKHSNST